MTASIHTIVDTAVLALQWARLELYPRRRAVSQRNHLALFAWALPPNSNGGVHRPLSFLRYGPTCGWRISAFHGHPPKDQREHGEELVGKIPATVELYEVRKAVSYPSFKLTPQIDGGFSNAVEYAKVAIKALADNPPSVVLASGPPFFVFVAAMFVARYFRVPLVLDYRDEWSECPFGFISHSRDDRYWEQRCLASASTVMFTTESQKDQQLKVFPQLEACPVYVLPNGWEPDDFSSIHEVNALAGEELVSIAHIGTLADHTAPDAFLKTLNQLLDISPNWISCLKIQFVGRRSQSANFALKEFLFPEVMQVVDHMRKSDAVAWMRQSTALLLIAHPELERYLPGKLFDYVAARRPILVYGDEGEASRLIECLEIGVRCPPRDAKSLEAALLNLKRWDMSVSRQRVSHWLGNHRRDRLASRMFDILDGLQNGGERENK